MVICVIASKVDYADAEEVPISKASEYAKSINAQFYQTSAKDGTGVNQLFQSVAQRLYVMSQQQ